MWYYLYEVVKIKKIIIISSAVVVIVLVVWAFWVSQDAPVIDNPNEPKQVKFKRTTDAYGDTPFESDKLEEERDFIEMKELAATEERIFLLSDGEWIEQSIIDLIHKRYETVQDGLKYLKNKDVVEKWKWNGNSFVRHIRAFEMDILQDYPDKADYIEALYDAEWTARQAIENPKQLKDDKAVKEVEAKIENARKLREQ